jgi:UDP-N-acetylglucosamine acyltransferase
MSDVGYRMSDPGTRHPGTSHIPHPTPDIRTIHPTALIDDHADLADDVTVGPYAVIGPNVKIGPGCRIESHVVITGHTTLGRNNRVGHHSVLGSDPQDLKYRGEDTTLTVGDNNDVREFVTMHLGTANGGGSTTVGSDNLLMVGAHIAHDSHVADRCILANNVLLAGHVTIEDCAVISGGAAIHHYVTVGRYAFVGGNAGVVHDCPPYMNTDGHPARVRGVNSIGLQRHQFDAATVERLKVACRLLYRGEAGNHATGVEQLRHDYPDDPIIRQVCQFAKRATASENGRYLETLRKDNKRRTPTR